MLALLVIAIVAFLIICFFEQPRFKSLTQPIKPPPEPPLLPYRTRITILNQSEAAFFLEMQKQLPQGFYIFPKIRIIDFIAPTNSDYGWRNKIWAKHVDFLICNSYFKPVMAIEINGGSHQRWDRKERDVFVNEVFRGAGLTLKTMNLGINFMLESVKIAKDLQFPPSSTAVEAVR